MEPEKLADLAVGDRLETLGVSQLSQWDVLMFLHRHGTSLTNAAQIGRLVRGDKAAVGAALERLESLGLIQRSRGSQGVRLYRISIPEDPLRYSCFLELISLAEKPGGRLQLLRHLQRGSLRPSIRARGLRIA
jgi:hypothetical protein